MRLPLITVFFIAFIPFQALAFEEEKCQVIVEKTCVDFHEVTIDGFAVSKCWKYEQKFKCISKEENHCNTFEDNRGCNELAVECKEQTDFGLCKHYEKKFVCGAIIEEKPEVKLVETEFKTLKDEKDLSGCNAEEVNKYCEIAEENCVEGAETRNINGKDVHKSCWKWDRKYVCRSDTYVDECKGLKNNCKEVSRDCIHQESDRCEHYEVKYQCSEKETKKVDCISTQFCLGGVCETKIRRKHSDFGQAISQLSVLANLKSTELEGCKCPDGKNECSFTEIDPKSCKFFKGQSSQCRNHTGSFNCCSDKGLLRPIFGCDQQEKDLSERRKLRLCHHVGTWKGKKLEFYKKWQSHCCFKSKISKIIQVEGRKQLGIGWGDQKNPDCRGLTLEEIQRIDFSIIDFSEVFDEVKSKAQSVSHSKQDQILQKTKDFKSNNQMSAELMNKKIKDFYSGGSK